MEIRTGWGGVDRKHWGMAMKDQADKVKAELIPMPKKRGRPATGKAMTAAERKRAQRERERQQIWGDFDIMGNWQNLTMTALLEGMASAVRAGSVGLVEMIAAELARRAAANKREDHVDDFEA